ncbi:MULTISPECIES: glycine oxidase ThiO [Rhizobium]|uniref:Glycine oxidase ThiO n=1 Tax=Rhizobium aouanii TaxID=3118145 RepID=A0ABU8CW49_9HYPH|nr:glycine oxidase ThiO [Rhizobium acaciae]MCW1414128.1 glycine oxidase ThiO [Rhizobium acaciae]MCW1746281.1 glycine oxidase ThiO [Rhizobium acaciae]MCW1754111.1 glycine oxidase ThiO [Rhizobium acaciae]
MRILVKGAGVAGLAVAHELASDGFVVEVADIAPTIGAGASWLAGGMLAPWCERESADQRVLAEGKTAADWWEAAVPGEVTRNGTLVVAPQRDQGELVRFASRTSEYEWLDEGGIAELEPALAGRFRKGLFFREEAHLDPRRALRALHRSLQGGGVQFHLGVAGDLPEGRYDHVIDCTGSAAIGTLERLRGVRGEMLYLETEEISLSRPIRLLHPRYPLYIVPRQQGRFMVGATMIESDADGPPTARSIMELLNAAYALHPAFGEARVIETGAGVRPAFPDNFPRVVHMGPVLLVNGLYRHGFLLAPAMAREVTRLLAAPQRKQAAIGTMT